MLTTVQEFAVLGMLGAGKTKKEMREILNLPPKSRQIDTFLDKNQVNEYAVRAKGFAVNLLLQSGVPLSTATELVHNEWEDVEVDENTVEKVANDVFNKIADSGGFASFSKYGETVAHTPVSAKSTEFKPTVITSDDIFILPKR